MKHFKATIKERGGHILHPEYYGDVTKEFLIDFWGCNEPDVVWYTIKEVTDEDDD
jgi:hypothetical protein